MADPRQQPQPPTDRELEILKVLWDAGPASVREVYEAMSRRSAGIVQNTVQAFLRTMEEKGLVRHRTEGRSFIYEPLLRPDEARRTMVGRVLQRVFDGALDQLVQSALDARPPSRQEIEKLEELIRRHKAQQPHQQQQAQPQPPRRGK